MLELELIWGLWRIRDATMVQHQSSVQNDHKQSQNTGEKEMCMMRVSPVGGLLDPTRGMYRGPGGTFVLSAGV